MSGESLPPLRIREQDGSPNAIPVFEIIVSNGTLTNIGGGRVRLATGAGAAGTGGTTYASTGGSYIVFSLETDLSAERNLVAGMGIVFADSGANSNLVIHPNTALLVTSSRTLTAGSGLTGGGNLSADRLFSVNQNVRTKTAGFFAGGNMSLAHLAEESRIWIPFNMESSACFLTATTAPTGAALIVNLVQWNAGLTASTALFASANRPQIPISAFAGSSYTFDVTTLYAGSYLGFQIDQVGSTIAGSNLTVTLVTLTS